jgi:hypothetical protein
MSVTFNIWVVVAQSGNSTMMRLLQLFGRASSEISGRPHNPAAPIVFMHVPKTSGVAFTTGLRAAIQPNRPIDGLDAGLFGRFNEFEALSEDVRQKIYLNHSDLPESDFVSGHFAFSTLVQRYKTANFLTILREPTSRILSHWLYWRASEESAQWRKYSEYVKPAVIRGLVHFLTCRKIAAQTDNLSVRMLLWPHRLIPPDDFISPRNDDTLIHEAIGRLKHFAFVDIIENPEMPMNLRAWLGRSVDYLPANETRPTPAPLARLLHTELVPEALDLLEARGRLDLRLWSLLVEDRIKNSTVDSVRQRVILRNAARYAWLSCAHGLHNTELSDLGNASSRRGRLEPVA